MSPILRRSWANFCRAVGREDWIDRGKGTGPVDYSTDDPGLRDDIEVIIRTRTAEEWIELFLAAGVPASPVLDIGELEDWSLTQDRAMVVTGTDPDLPGVKYLRPHALTAGEEFAVVQSPPRLGEHTHAVLSQLGYDDETRARLLADGVIAAPPRSEEDAQ